MADHQSREEIAAQAVAVRAELKTWEKEFVASHEGKKASQDDIKERPDIGKLHQTGHSSPSTDPTLQISCQVQRVPPTEEPRGCRRSTRTASATGTLRVEEAQTHLSSWASIP